MLENVPIFFTKFDFELGIKIAQYVWAKIPNCAPLHLCQTSFEYMQHPTFLSQYKSSKLGENGYTR